MDGRRVTRAAAKAAAEAAAQGEDSDATRVPEQTSEQPRAKGRGSTKRKTVTFKEPLKGEGKAKGKGKAAKGTDADDTVGSAMQVSSSSASGHHRSERAVGLLASRRTRFEGAPRSPGALGFALQHACNVL